MPDYHADQVVSIVGPSRRGWFQLSLLPHGLDAPALVVVTAARRSPGQPIARLAVGPDHPVCRAVFFPAAELDLELHVFAGRGEVRASIERIEHARLIRGIGARLRDMRHLGLRSIVARGLGGLRRMSGRGEPVGMLRVDPLQSIKGWLDKHGRASHDTIAILQAVCERHGGARPVVVLDTRGAESVAIERSLAAIERQIGAPYETIMLACGAAGVAGISDRLGSSTLLFWVEAGEEPAEHAFLALAAAIEGEGGGIAFADWIEIDAGLVQPVFCAGWDAVRAAAGFELRGAIALGGGVLRALLANWAGPSPGSIAARGAAINALATTMVESAIAHVPAPLTRVVAGAWRLPDGEPAAARLPADVAPAASPPASVQSDRRPLASLVVPTHARAEFLIRCVESCFDHTRYRPLELIVVDHASSRPDMRAALADIRQRTGAVVVREEGPFNFSRLINVGVACSTGEYVVLLNDDVEATSGTWLEQLVAMLEQPRIGIVGPRLLYPDGSIQHNGVALGMGGLAGHPGRGSRPEDRDPTRCDPWPRTVSAVTAACLVTRRSVFDAVGGMDEKLAVEFNDVDLCLRVVALGLRCVVDPRISLVHHEQATRGSRVSGSHSTDRMHFTARWGQVLADDPWFSPNLTLEDDSCGLADPPRTTRNLTPRRRVLTPLARK